MTFKRGDTFTATVLYYPNADDPVDLSAVTVTSSVKDGNGVLSSGSVSVAGDNLSFTVTFASTATKLWTTGSVDWDVKFVYSGITFRSETETIGIVDYVTP